MPMSPEQHQVHMQKVEAGLNQILQSEDINEIKQIAQSLLQEEEGEESMENQPEARPEMAQRVMERLKQGE